jgi:hypothetical protein
MEPSVPVCCAVWYDNTWWEALLPVSWSFRQDESIKGWPELFESPRNARLWIRTRKHIDISGWNFAIAPRELPTEHKKAFLLTASDASMQECATLDPSKMDARELATLQHSFIVNRDTSLAAAVPKLTKHELGELVGFTYERPERDETLAWAGYFSHDPWMLNVACRYPRAAQPDAQVAREILTSIRFRGPNGVPPPTAAPSSSRG